MSPVYGYEGGTLFGNTCNIPCNTIYSQCGDCGTGDCGTGDCGGTNYTACDQYTCDLTGITCYTDPGCGLCGSGLECSEFGC